jgi:predicted DNA-binding transcriptional regulator AlpA
MKDSVLSHNNEASEILDKKGYAARWHFSSRTVDNLLAQGLPHCKIGKRRVRIVTNEADAWMRSRFGTQRHGSVKAAA